MSRAALLATVLGVGTLAGLSRGTVPPHSGCYPRLPSVDIHVGTVYDRPSNATAAARTDVAWNAVLSGPMPTFYQLGVAWNFYESSSGINLALLQTQLAAFAAAGLAVELGIGVTSINYATVPADLSDPSNPQRLRPDLTFASPTLVSRYLAFLDAIVPTLANASHVFHLTIANEVDVYVEAFPQHAAGLTALVATARERVQNITRALQQPALSVGVTVTSKAMLALGARPAVAALVAVADGVPVTYYPLSPTFTVLPPSSIVADLPRLLHVYHGLGKCLLIQEIGYPSSAGTASTEALQAAFVRAIGTAIRTADVAAQNLLTGLSLFKLVDWTPADCQGQAALILGAGVSHAGLLDYLCSVGVMHASGGVKPALAAFDATVRSLPALRSPQTNRTSQRTLLDGALLMLATDCNVSGANFSSPPELATGAHHNFSAAWNDPFVLEDADGSLVMYASVGAIDGSRGVEVYRLRDTGNGSGFLLDPRRPVLTPDPVAGFYGVETPAVVFFRGQYHMYVTSYYTPCCDSTTHTIAHAVSPNGIDWTMQNWTTFNKTGVVTDWDGLVIGEPAPVVVNDTLYLYYTGVGYDHGIANITQSIGLAVSTDGATFTRGLRVHALDNTQYPSSDGWYGFSTPHANLIEGQIHLFYTLVTTVGGWHMVGFGHAVSPTGWAGWVTDRVPFADINAFHWTRREIRSPAPIIHNGTLTIFFGGDQVYETVNGQVVWHLSRFGIGRFECAFHGQAPPSPFPPRTTSAPTATPSTAAPVTAQPVSPAPVVVGTSAPTVTPTVGISSSPTLLPTTLSPTTATSNAGQAGGSGSGGGGGNVAAIVAVVVVASAIVAGLVWYSRRNTEAPPAPAELTVTNPLSEVHAASF